MKKKIKAEIWDKVQYLFREYYDRMTHGLFYYDGTLNVDILKKAYFKLIDQIPVFKSSYIDGPLFPYWKVNDITADDFFNFIETDNPLEVINKYLYEVIPPKSKTQIRLKLIRTNGKDILLLLANHMCGDGGDMKIFIASVAKLYNDLLIDENANIVYKNGDRSLEQIYNSMDKEDAKKARRLYKNVSFVKNKILFPYTKKSKQDTSRIIVRKIPAETFLNLKEKSKNSNASINDIFVTSYIRSLYKLCDTKNKTITIPCMMDLRRHIKGGQSQGFTNLTGSMPCMIECDNTESFLNTLDKVVTNLDKSKKDKFVGLHSMPLLKLAYTIFPKFIAETAIKIGYKNALLGMSNIGNIDGKYLKLGDVSLVDVMFTGGIKRKPYIQLVLTTFNNIVSLNVASICNDEDEKLIIKLLENMIIELENFLKL